MSQEAPEVLTGEIESASKPLHEMTDRELLLHIAGAMTQIHGLVMSVVPEIKNAVEEVKSKGIMGILGGSLKGFF